MKNQLRIKIKNVCYSINIFIEYKPQSPTTTYTVFSNQENIPNNKLTKLKFAAPTNPQLIAPTIINPNAIFCNISIFNK